MLFDFGKSKVIKYLSKHPNAKTVVVAGSYGRKSAILSLGTILGSKYTVSFGINNKVDSNIILFDFESADQFPDFKADLVVVTACRDEQEAQRYFSLANKANAVIVNRCDVSQELIEKYLTNQNTVSYGDELPAQYYFENTECGIDGQAGNIVNLNGEHIPVKLKVLGEHNVRPVVMACAVARLFGVEREKILEAAQSIVPLNGRMSPAKGINEGIIIDDSADGTPLSVRYGLSSIYQMNAASRMIVTDDASKLDGINFDLITEAIILTDNIPQQIPEHFKYFNNRNEMLSYLGQRSEENGLILLEIPVPEIIEKYLW